MHKLQKIATPVLCNIRKVNCPFTLCFFSVNAVPSSTFPIVTEMKHPHDKYGSFSAISRVDSGICVEWADGEKSNFHDIWIRDCCKCSQCQEANSHQKISLGVDVGVVATSTEYRDGRLYFTWNDGHRSDFAMAWLKAHSCSSTSLQKRRNDMKLNMEKPRSYKTLDFESIISDEKQLFVWLDALNHDAVCVVENAPNEANAVTQLAERVSAISHDHLYGRTFDVIAEKSPINIAYSDFGLEPHMDLAYYESPPGLQFLHCIRFDATVQGGESTFADGFAIAENLRLVDPEAFHTLTRVPATFLKLHKRRSKPAHMEYRRPHIQLNNYGDVTNVFWSPPFQGPLRAPEEDIVPYYRAVKSFRDLMFSKESMKQYWLELRLSPGQIVTFNQRRMLHGRQAFTSFTGVRHLRGCYVNIDDYLSTYRTLCAKFSASKNALGVLTEEEQEEIDAVSSSVPFIAGNATE